MKFEESEHRLVRVQKDFSGIRMDAQGNVSLSRVGDTPRNTMHFCMDGIVASHESGDWDDAGVVIIVDPSEMDAPCSGARLEDTWYHCGNDRTLNVGKAQLFAPEGTDVPEGIAVTRYKVGEREKTVEASLNKAGIPMLSIGRNNAGPLHGGAFLLADYQKFSNAFASRHGNGGPCVLDSHSHSFDSSLEKVSGGLKAALDDMESGKAVLTTAPGSEGERETWEVVLEKAKSHLSAIDNYVLENPAIANHAGLHFMGVADSIEASIKRAETLGMKYQNRFGLVDSNGQVAVRGVGLDEMWSQIESDESLQDMRVFQEWPGTPPDEQVIGEVQDVFEKEMRRMQRPAFAERC